MVPKIKYQGVYIFNRDSHLIFYKINTTVLSRSLQEQTRVIDCSFFEEEVQEVLWI